MDARFNLMLFQHTKKFQDEEMNHLLAMRKLRDSGYVIPKITPMFAAESFDCYLCPKDFVTKAVRG